MKKTANLYDESSFDVRREGESSKRIVVEMRDGTAVQVRVEGMWSRRELEVSFAAVMKEAKRMITKELVKERSDE